MATMNPLERKARNSFIKGLVVAGLIGLIGIIVLVIILVQMKGEEQARLDDMVTIGVLNQDVKSGQLITSAMLTKVKIEKSVIPSNAIQNPDSYFLQDQNGNTVGSRINENGDIENYVEIEGREYTINDLVGNTGTITTQNGQTSTVVLEGVPAMAKIDMSANTILTSDSIEESFELTGDSTRKQEYNMISVPADIENDDVVDIRLRLPDGTDYIVVSKKRVTILDEGGIPSLNTISFEMDEAEILMMSNAIVEAYMMEGSKLYVTRYVEPGMQAGAITTYVPSGEVQNLINNDPNVVTQAKQELITRFNNYTNNRNNVTDELNTMDADERADAVATGTSSEISDAQDARQSYLDSMQ